MLLAFHCHSKHLSVIRVKCIKIGGGYVFKDCFPRHQKAFWICLTLQKGQSGAVLLKKFPEVSKTTTLEAITLTGIDEQDLSACSLCPEKGTRSQN